MPTTRTPRLLVTAALSVLPVAAVLGTTTPARAGAYAAADLDVGMPLHATAATYGLGAGGRLGWRFNVGPAWIAPEVGGHYLAFLGTSGIYTDQPNDQVARVFGGARFGLAGPVQPSFYGHVGAGWLGAHAVGPALDVGFALDLALVPHFTFGAQLGYDVALIWHGTDPTFGAFPPYVVRWINAGLHAGVAF